MKQAKQHSDQPPRISEDVPCRGRRRGAGRGIRRAGHRPADAHDPLRPHAADRPDPSQGDRDVRRRTRQAFLRQDQGRDLSELAARQHSRDAAVGAGGVADDDHGRAGVVLQLHEAASTRSRCRTWSPRRTSCTPRSTARSGRRSRKMGEAPGFKVLGYFLLGGRHIVNKVRPVQKPADCQGLKLRVINSPVYLQTFRAARRQSGRDGPVRALPRRAAGRGRRLRVSAARSRRAEDVRGDQVRLARPAHDRLLHHLDQQEAVGRHVRRRSRA